MVSTTFMEIIRHAPFIAKPEGEATNLDAQVAERLYICIYVRHSQLLTSCLCPRNRICSYSYGQELLHISL